MVPYLLGFRKAESWSTSQISYEHYIFWINVLPAIFIVPIYEEIVFRGCLLIPLNSGSTGMFMVQLLLLHFYLL